MYWPRGKQWSPSWAGFLRENVELVKHVSCYLQPLWASRDSIAKGFRLFRLKKILLESTVADFFSTMFYHVLSLPPFCILKCFHVPFCHSRKETLKAGPTTKPYCSKLSTYFACIFLISFWKFRMSGVGRHRKPCVDVRPPPQACSPSWPPPPCFHLRLLLSTVRNDLLRKCFQDLYFGGWTLQNKVFSNQNKGHLGCRYTYVY